MSAETSSSTEEEHTITDLSILVAGVGNMGRSHTLAYREIDGFEVAGIVTRTDSGKPFADELGVPHFTDYSAALAETRPQAVSINTYTGSHFDYVTQALQADCHVFVEKPLAETVEQAEAIVALATERRRKLVVGYILRHHPSWTRFVEIARTLGKPLVMRMNLNQQSAGENWQHHQNIMESQSPIVDCGVHYVDVMCQMTRSRPRRVHAIGARLSDALAPDMYNYGHLQLTFEDGSVGWYEAGWGPMVSEVAFFVKDVVGPKGCVSIVSGATGDSDAIDSHTQANCLQLHHASLDDDGNPALPDEFIDTDDEPDHLALCHREQAWLLDAIRNDLDLTDHMQDAVDSLRIVLAADESVRTGQVIEL